MTLNIDKEYLGELGFDYEKIAKEVVEAALDFDTPGDFSFLEEEEDAFHPDTGELILGDIMIAVGRMREQAETYGHGEVREYAFLIAHSMLHLMGYDHMEPNEAAVMEKKQEEILEELGILRK